MSSSGLRRQQGARGNLPKFVVIPSVFVSNPLDAREGRAEDPQQKVRWKEQSDSWPAFPSTRRELLRAIVDHPVQNVVFLPGDIHCSSVARIHFSGSARAERLKAASITSSAFYWPFPFAYRAWNFAQEDNFCRVDVERERHRLVVRPFDSEGSS